MASPYGAGLARLRAGLLAGECRLKPAAEIYPGFQGMVAQVSGLPPVGEGNRYSRTDRLAMAAARDAVAEHAIPSSLLRPSGIVMASTVAGLTEIDPGIAQGPAAWYRDGGLSRGVVPGLARGGVGG